MSVIRNIQPPQDEESRQRLLDIAAQADASEGIRQGFEDVARRRTRPASQVFDAIRREYAQASQTFSENFLMIPNDLSSATPAAQTRVCYREIGKRLAAHLQASWFSCWPATLHYGGSELLVALFRRVRRIPYVEEVGGKNLELVPQHPVECG